jgi:hypothetical protein
LFLVYARESNVVRDQLTENINAMMELRRAGKIIVAGDYPVGRNAPDSPSPAISELSSRVACR